MSRKWGKFKFGMQIDLYMGSDEGQMSQCGYFRQGHVGKSFKNVCLE